MAEIDKIIVADGATARAYAPLVYATAFDYDFAVSGDAAAGIAISTNFVPVGARVIGGWYEVLTTFTTNGADGGTLALSLVGANDLVTAIAVSDASNPWDVDLTKRRPLKSIAAALTTRKQVVITSATQTTTAGKLFGVVEWIYPASTDSSGH